MVYCLRASAARAETAQLCLASFQMLVACTTSGRIGGVLIFHLETQRTVPNCTRGRMKQFNLIIATVCVQLNFHQALWLTMTSNPLIWLPGVQRDNIPFT